MQWQFRVLRGTVLTREQIRTIKREYLATGTAPDGMQIVLTVWGEDEAKSRELLGADWRGGCRPGLVDRYGDARTTLHDYDTRKPPTIHEVLEIARILRVEVDWLEYTPSRRGYHLAIRWKQKWHPLETIALQAMLGSDPKREAFNLLRVRSGTDVIKNRRWNVLFARKLD